MFKRKKKYGQSTLEFLALMMFLIGTFLIFQKYIARGMTGRWKGIGDSLGEGRIYDPKKTTECAYDYQYTHTWYSVSCWEEDCEQECLRVTATAAACESCIIGCQVDECAY